LIPLTPAEKPPGDAEVTVPMMALALPAVLLVKPSSAVAPADVVLLFVILNNVPASACVLLNGNTRSPERLLYKE